MTEIKKDTNLLNGKGENDDIEWITVNGSHIPIKDGETPKQAIKNHFESKSKVNNVKNYSPELKQEVQRLVQTLTEVKKIKLKELVDLIKSFEPIDLQINDRKISAAFDKYSAEKNIYTRGNSTHRGFTFKLNNIKELPEFIKDSKYAYSKQEVGKNTKQHKGVKEWHYFKKDVQVGDEKYDVVINVRDKGDSQYVYEVTFK